MVCDSSSVYFKDPTSELKVNERSDLFGHELYHELHHNEEDDEPYDPIGAYIRRQHSVGPTLRHEVEYSYSQHHHAPYRPCLAELRNLHHLEILENILYDQNRRFEISGPEENP